MKQPILEVQVGIIDPSEPELPLASEGVLRYVWHSRFGDMLVEVRDGQSFVNGQRVEQFKDSNPEKPT